MIPGPGVAFYTVTSADFFLGAVGLLNSLRVCGHREPLFVLDRGLSDWQRDALEGHATVIPARRERASSLAKLELPLAHPSDVMVLLDADIIVTRRLEPLIEEAAADRLVAFANDRERWFDAWAELLDLSGLRRGPYFTSSTIVLSRAIAERVLAPAGSRIEALDSRGTWLARGSESNPLYYADQDILNAVSMAVLGEGERVVLERRLSANPPFTGLRIEDMERLRCGYRDGARPFMLHHWADKPWLVPLRSNIYSRLLTRLLLDADVPVRIPPERLPLRLRRGARAAAERARVDLMRTPAGIRRRLSRGHTEGRAWPG